LHENGTLGSDETTTPATHGKILPAPVKILRAEIPAGFVAH